ncbi:LysR family transcriptional regulator [Bifidobacterium tsurumiense]|uniref:LysR family transcriptional regulator n=1 Tax=Bifidobacterium tsurumiense TaxID=356829 RepID=UPI0012B3B762|nr:LysR family transcriptional regulator [Bifidobacterium tsurumiense]MSS13336.1 LysR family transcriptional regulator [Bifidobacterium tsurumiense]
MTSKSRSANHVGLDLRVLRYFIAVAEEGNITWAADLLQISQPTLSRQLRSMERDLDISLFHRGTRAMTLTPEGRLLYERAKTIVALADKAVQDVHSTQGGLSGTVTLACGETRNLPWILDRMASFRKANPAVQFGIRTYTADIAKQQLDQGILDLAILVEPATVESYDYIRLRERDIWCVTVPESSPLAQLKQIKPKHLSGQTLLLPSRPEVQREVMNWLGSDADSVSIAGTCNFNLNGNMMVAAGLGMRIGFDMGHEIEGTKNIPMNPPVETTCLLAWRRGRILAPAVSAFTEYVFEALHNDN